METLKSRMCEAFCAEVDARAIANGYAVATPYQNRMGDTIGVYAIGEAGGPYRVIDTALTVAFLEADGATLDNESRRAHFKSLVDEYGAQYDEGLGEIYIPNVSEAELPQKIVHFATMLLRLNDMIWTTTERTRNTFRDDIKAALRNELSEYEATITEDEPVSDNLAEVTPDMVFSVPGRLPVALFIATDESKLWQAMLLQVIANHEAKEEVVVVALLESKDALSSKIITKADNRLDAIPRYEDEPKVALQRIVREVVGRSNVLH